MESIDQSLFIAAPSLLAAMYEVDAMSWNSGPVVLIVDERYLRCYKVIDVM